LGDVHRVVRVVLDLHVRRAPGRREPEEGCGGEQGRAEQLRHGAYLNLFGMELRPDGRRVEWLSRGEPATAYQSKRTPADKADSVRS
jgi:hypothetical protein